MSKPHIYKVSKTQWACSPSVNDKHILRCIFGNSAYQAYSRYRFCEKMTALGKYEPWPNPKWFSLA